MATRKRVTRSKRKPARAAAAPRRRRSTRRRSGLSEGLSAGVKSAVPPILMGALGGIAGILLSNLMPTQKPWMKLGIGAVGAGLCASVLKAPNLAAGLMAGVTMPAIAGLLIPAGEGKDTMNEGYLNEELPAVIDDGEYLDEGELSANYLSANYLSDDDFMDVDEMNF